MATEPIAAVSSVSPEPIFRLATGFMATKHLFVANEVGLFTALAGGPATLDELAARTGVPRRTTRILADAMLALGLLERREDRYQNRPVAASYLSGRTSADLGPFLRFWNRISYPAWVQFEAAVRSDQVPTRQGRFTEEDQQVFSSGVAAFMVGPARALATAYDFSQHHRVLDLGGGTGTYLLAVLEQYPGLEATLFEPPPVIPVARESLDRDPLGNRVQVVAGDFLADPIPAGHDAVIIANVVHLFSPEHNRSLLRRTRDSVAAGARLLLVDLWTDPTHTQPLAAALMAGEFIMVAGEGEVYSVGEAQVWLQECGWRLLDHWPLPEPESLVVAEAV